MLNSFPNLLTYGFFAPTLLRVAAALVFAYLAYTHFKNKDQIAQTGFPIIGKGEWIAWLAVLIEGAAALGLFLGYYTQISAIVGAAVAIKSSFWSGKYPDFFILSRSTSFLLLIICLSLLVTGAGKLAFDLPL